MKMCFSVEEGRVLHGLLEDASGDIVVRLDAAGFIIHASENAQELGMDLSSLLLMPHIADFAEADHAPEVARHVTQVFAGKAQRGWVEFPVRACQGHDENDQNDLTSDPACTARECQRWYALSLKPLEPDDGISQGAIGLLRSVEHKHALEDEINARAQSDPLTGLANRHTFCAYLRRTIAEDSENAMAVLAIDGLRAVFMQYGQRTADEIQWGFAKFIQAMTVNERQPGHEVAQLDGERFAVLLPGMSVKQARAWTQDVLDTFAGLTVSSSRRTPELTASAGIASVEVTEDWTMRQAELGLVMARAGGGMQVGVCNQPSRDVTCGAAVERAMEQAVQRAIKRRI